MTKVKDGFWKQLGSKVGSNDYLLKAAGGYIGVGNSSGEVVPLNNGTKNENLNADMVDGLHATNFVKFYLSPLAGSAPASSAKSWFENTMPSGAGAIVYNVPGSEKTIIVGKSTGAYGHMLQLNYDDKYLRILRYYAGNWKSNDWEKISAGYADSAGNSDTIDGYHYNNLPYVPKLAWHSENSGESVNDLVCGTSFYYTTHGAPTNGVVASFTGTHNSYQLQIQGKYFGKEFWYRSKNGDNGTWNAWTQVIDTNNIGLQSVTYADSAGDADKLDGYHANDFATAGHTHYIGTTAVQTYSNYQSLTGINKFLFQDDGSLAIYTTDGGRDCGYEHVNIQTCFDNTDPQTHVYVNDYSYRCNLVLQPRGGQVVIGKNMNGVGNTTEYKLRVGGSIQIEGDIYTTTGFKKNGSDDSYVLLGGGGHKLISDFATSGHTHYIGDKPASDLSSTYPQGISVGGIYANGYPFQFGSTITAYGSGGYFQIAGQWNSDVTGASNYDFPTEMYIRGRRDSYDVWTTWTRVLTDRNYTNVLDNRYYTETEADNRFVNVTGDTMTGLLTTASGSSHNGIKIGNTYINAIDGNLIFQNNSAIRFGGDSWDWNIWAGLKYEHSSKTIYLGLAGNSVFTTNSDQSGGTLNLSGIYNISSTFYNIKVGSIISHIPVTSGWYTIAQVSGYFNYDLYITGSWWSGMPSTVRVNICNINGTTKITQFAGYIGNQCSQIRLGQVNTDVWDVQLYINGQTDTLGDQKCIFTGYGGLIVYNTNTVSSTSYSVTNTLAFGQISGISLTTGNYTSYLDERYYTETEVNNLLAKYLPLSGGWMDTGAQIYFKGLNQSTSVWGSIGYRAYSGNGNNVMHTVTSPNNTGALYITTNGYDSANDYGGLAIDNDGVTAFGAGDSGSVFRVINEDNVSDGAQFYVTKSSGTVVKRSLTASNFISNAATGTQPYACTSTTLNTNLNADLLDGLHEISFYRHRGSYGKSYTAASIDYTLGPGTYTTSESGYSGTLLSFNSSGSASSIQFWTHYQQGNLYYRTSIDSNRWGKTNGEWTRILDSDSYNYYAPTLTGGGASGTWNISITGNADSAGNADTVDNKHASTLLHLDGYYYIPGNGNNSSTKLWSKIGSITFTAAWQECGGSLTFYEWEARRMMGELKFNIRTSSSKSSAGSTIVWMNLTNKDFESSFIICRTGDGKYDIYFEYPASSYNNVRFYIISQYDNGYLTWQNGSALTSTEPTYVNERFVSRLSSWVGNADYATSAGTASTAGSVAWANITGKPFNWSGQSGQPTWLWGSNDGTNYYVWNPSNFSVNYANSAGSADYADSAESATKLQTSRKLWSQPFDGTADVNGQIDIIINKQNSSTVVPTSSAIMLGSNGSGHTGYHAGIAFNALRYNPYVNHIHAWIGLGPYTTTAAAECYPLVFATNGSTTTGDAPTERMRITPSGDVGIGVSNPVYKLEVAGSICGSVIYANRNGSTTDGGVSLYSSSDPMTYGIAFRGTGTYGTHGFVTSTNDWATYLTMNDNTARGWIFRRGSTNVASIAGSGDMAIGQHLKFSNEAHISTNRSTDYHYGYTFNLGGNAQSIGMYSGPVGEAGGVVISPDGCLIYNSSDCGYNLQVRDKDLGGDLTNIDTLTFGIEQSGYYAWSRGGFKKNGSDDSYVLLGGGGHKALSDFATASHNHSFTLGATTITTEGTYTAITGPFAVHTDATDSKAFSIYRSGASEGVQHWVDDGQYHIDYTNDETSSAIHIRIINTDIESGNKTNTTDYHYYLDCYGNFHPGSNNTGSIGTEGYKWANMYATTFHGSLDGNASTATSADYASSAGSVAWANITGKPSSFNPSSHTHDDRYYTESESDSRYVNVTGDTMTGDLHVYAHTYCGYGTGSSVIDYNVYAMYVGTNGTRTSTAGSYIGGIAFTHMIKYSGGYGYCNSPQGWIGLRTVDYPGSERSSLVFATKPGTGTSNTGDDIPIERMCITPAGNVGIGTTSPSQKLHVNGAGIFNNTGSTSYNTDGITIGAGDYTGRYITAYGKTGTSYFNMGYAPSDRNCAELLFNYSGSGSDNNYAGLSMYGGENTISVYAGYTKSTKYINAPGFVHPSYNSASYLLTSNGGAVNESKYLKNFGSSNYVTFTVGGDANTYYPVRIHNPADYYPYSFITISRAYNETAPDTWYTSTHKGGLSMCLFWNSSSYWDGNSSGGECFCVRLNETYCNMVAGMDRIIDGTVVWLRGGGATYHIHGMAGTSQGVTVYLESYTDHASRTFSPRTWEQRTPVSVRWPGYADGADYASSAGSVAWGNVTGKPFNWSGQSGQPTWLWGSNDGANYYVWNPSNFSVNYANSAGSADYADSAESATQATNLTPENTAHYFRDPNNSTWRGGMIWGSAGSESMSFVAANSGTRFQFVGGSDIANWDSGTWQSANPYLTIYSSGIVTPGSATASEGFIKSGYDNTYVLLAGGGHKLESNLSVSYASSAGSVAWANITGKPFNWSGQSGQPSWLWGSNDGTNYYIWDPSNFSVNYADSAGSAERARYLTCPDTRSSAPAPGDYTATSTGVSFDFKESSVTGLSGYSGVMTFRPYGSAQDWTGGEAHQIAFLAGGGLYHRIGTSSWDSWERILTSSNWSSYISIPSVGNDTNYYPIRSYTSGLQISSYSGSTDCALFVPYATANQTGVVSTEAQTFSGEKTFPSIRLRSTDTANFGGYLYFGDGSYAYLAELADDQLTLNASQIFLGIGGRKEYYIDETEFRPVTANSTSSSGIALGSSDYRFTCGYFSDKVYAYKGFYESSDERLKNILNPVKVNLDDLSKLRKVYYLWKDRTEDEIQLGMIAQDVQRLYPELVSVDKETGYLSLAYDKLSVLALEAIDVLYKEHKKLKKHVDELEKLLINNKIY